VAVEKLGISEIRANLGDRKCLPDPRRSFIAHPDAFYFGDFLGREFFNSHRRLHQSAAGEMINIAHFQHIGEGRKVVAFPKKQTTFTQGDAAAWYGQCR
jgi:hypothetical protein